MRITNPPKEITGARVLLRRHRYPADCLPLRAAIDASFEHLRGWMAWAQSPATDELVATFVEAAARDFGGDSAGYRLDRIEADPIEAPREVGRSMIWCADRVIASK